MQDQEANAGVTQTSKHRRLQGIGRVWRSGWLCRLTQAWWPSTHFPKFYLQDAPARALCRHHRAAIGARMCSRGPAARSAGAGYKGAVSAAYLHEVSWRMYLAHCWALAAQTKIDCGQSWGTTARYQCVLCWLLQPVMSPTIGPGLTGSQNVTNTRAVLSSAAIPDGRLRRADGEGCALIKQARSVGTIRCPASCPATMMMMGNEVLHVETNNQNMVASRVSDKRPCRKTRPNTQTRRHTDVQTRSRTYARPPRTHPPTHSHTASTPMRSWKTPAPCCRKGDTQRGPCRRPNATLYCIPLTAASAWHPPASAQWRLECPRCDGVPPSGGIY